MKHEKKPPLNLLLRKARVERGWSQKELARLIDTNFFMVSRWEHGSNVPSLHYRRRLCEVFDKTPAELGLLPLSSGSRLWNIPIARNPFFTGREDLLALLHKRLSTARKAALTQALSGLGGIGKTQTAVEYAYRYGDDYAYVFWMRAATRETLVSDFVMLAELLDLPEQEEQDQQQMVAAVKRWLAANQDWLLILDNADDLSLAQEFLPTRHQSYILYTTRAQATGALAAPVEVEQLTVEEGTLLLLRWSKRLDMDTLLDDAQAEDWTAAERIVRVMDGLPLALVQAAAYVEETGCTLQDYLHLYTTHRKELLQRRSRFLLDYPETVATTWSLSFLRVERQSPIAANLLRLCAFLAPDAIPEELLARGASELGAVLEAETFDQFKLNAALEVLLNYSLVRRNGSTHMLSIHRLVQAVLKDNMKQETQRTWAERTVRAINTAFPKAEESAGGKQHYYLQYYMPHVLECATLIEQYRLHFPEAAQLLYRAGTFLFPHGLYHESESLHELALAIREQVFGSEHPAVAESLNALAMLARLQEDYERAEGLHCQALAIRERTLGPHHPTTAQSLNNLGVLYRAHSKYEQAEPLFRQALNILEQSLGSDHPETLYSIINLAKLYKEQGKYEQSELLAQQVLASSERVLEPGHNLIAQSLSLRARLAFEQGNYQQAEPLLKRALAIVEQSFGPKHLSTAERLNDLAELYFAQGRYTQAQSLCRRALSICQNALGSDHPDTVSVRSLLSRIISKREAEQGADHPPAPPPR